MIDFRALKQKLSVKARIVTDIENFEEYCHDATIARGVPSAIIFARTEDDIVETVRFCQEQNLPLVPRGAGTGLSGGCVAPDGGLLLSLEEMTELQIDTKSKTAYAQTGVITKTILEEAIKVNLYYPPDPASYDESTIGGNVAENAGGLKCVKYGVTKDYVLGIKGVTAAGEKLATGLYNRQAGFEFTDLFIGSEGTLVIITEIALKLIDIPLPGETILTVFDHPKDAAQTVADIRHDSIVPLVIEFLDGDAAECSNRYEKNVGFDKVGAILLIESEQKDADRIEAICSQNCCTFIQREVEPEKAEQLWKIRRNLSKAITKIAKVRISEDVAVPISKFPELVAFVAEMNRNSQLRINSFGHAGDGNLHVNFLGMSGSDKESRMIDEQIVVLLKKTLTLGGTLSGEHGIGLAKKKYLPMEYTSPTLQFMKKLKSVFDEHRLLNADKIF